nr:hypothetical protein OH820_02365 [Streptomyces sp. NBC_00857]
MRTASAEQDVDQTLLVWLYAVAQEGCAPCQQQFLDRLAPDSTSTASLARWAGESVQELYGTIPEEADDQGALSELLRIYIDESMYRRAYEPVLTPCQDEPRRDQHHRRTRPEQTISPGAASAWRRPELASRPASRNAVGSSVHESPPSSCIRKQPATVDLKATYAVTFSYRVAHGAVLLLIGAAKSQKRNMHKMPSIAKKRIGMTLRGSDTLAG